MMSFNKELDFLTRQYTNGNKLANLIINMLKENPVLEGSRVTISTSNKYEYYWIRYKPNIKVSFIKMPGNDTNYQFHSLTYKNEYIEISDYFGEALVSNIIKARAFFILSKNNTKYTRSERLASEAYEELLNGRDASLASSCQGPK